MLLFLFIWGRMFPKLFGSLAVWLQEKTALREEFGQVPKKSRKNFFCRSLRWLQTADRQERTRH
jgi:hypothetical protein